VLVISGTAWPGINGKDADDADLLVVARPHDALHGYRFDLIVGPMPAGEDKAYRAWWVESVMCRLVPDGRIVHT
jgi:hypothetical protein